MVIPCAGVLVESGDRRRPGGVLFVLPPRIRSVKRIETAEKMQARGQAVKADRPGVSQHVVEQHERRSAPLVDMAVKKESRPRRLPPNNDHTAVHIVVRRRRIVAHSDANGPEPEFLNRLPFADRPVIRRLFHPRFKQTPIRAFGKHPEVASKSGSGKPRMRRPSPVCASSSVMPSLAQVLYRDLGGQSPNAH